MSLNNDNAGEGNTQFCYPKITPEITRFVVSGVRKSTTGTDMIWREVETTDVASYQFLPKWQNVDWTPV